MTPFKTSWKGGFFIWNKIQFTFRAMEFPLYMYFILASILAGITAYIKPKSPLYLRLLQFFLMITIVMEGIGVYLWSHNMTNLTLYNWFTAFEFCFYLFILGSIVHSKKMKMAIQRSLLIYGLMTITNILFIQGRTTFHTVTYSIGCLLIVAGCIYYFFELFKLRNYVNLVREPPFWICTGLLFYYCCSFPLLGLVNSLGNFPLVIMNNLDFFLTLMNVILYSLFTIAFLCRIKIPKYI